MFQRLRSAFFGPSDAVRIAEASRDRARAEAVASQTSAITAAYENAHTTDENKRNWWNVDFMSAKAANSFSVRRTLRSRSRYEVANNPYLFGVVNSNADDFIGTIGPTLQVLTDDTGYNREVEASWQRWSDEVALIEKLRVQKIAKEVDGEGFLVCKTVHDLEHPVKLYPCDIEADQVTTPAPTSVAELWVDGLVLHPITGRPTAYHVLRSHPGDFYFPELNPLTVDKISAKFVLHWFRKFRPGQVRGIPVFSSSLDVFAELRAFRKAVLGAAQIAASLTAVLTQSERSGAYGDEDDDTELEVGRRVRIDRNYLTALGPGQDMKPFDPKQPTTSYEMFQEKCLGEGFRPLNYPLNLALGTSQKFNFSSAKLDHVNYRNGITVERHDCNRVTMTPLFREWFFEALLSQSVRAWKGIEVPPHSWHWPGFASLDPKVDADSDHARLSQGTLTWREYWASRGRDWRDEAKQQAEEMKLFDELHLQFGEPITRTVSETVEDPNAEREAANAV